RAGLPAPSASRRRIAADAASIAGSSPPRSRAASSHPERTISQRRPSTGGYDSDTCERDRDAPALNARDPLAEQEVRSEHGHDGVQRAEHRDDREVAPGAREHEEPVRSRVEQAQKRDGGDVAAREPEPRAGREHGGDEQ